MHTYDFISLLIVLTTSIGLIELCKIKKRTRLLNYLIAYFLIGFIMFTFGHYSLLKIYIQNNNLLLRKIFELINSLFSLFELLFFASFIELQYINRSKNTTLIKTNYFFVIILLLNLLYASLIKTNESVITNTSVLYNILEFAFLLIFCLRYFYHTLHKPIDTPPINKHKLQIVGSLFIYISVSLPLLIISEKITIPYKNIYNAIYVTHYIVLLIVLVSITVALKKQKTIFYA